MKKKDQTQNYLLCHNGPPTKAILLLMVLKSGHFFTEFHFFSRQFWLPKMSTTEIPAGTVSSDIFDECVDEGGGQQHEKKPPNNLKLCHPGAAETNVLSDSSIPILLITANVGSIFDDPQNLFPQWTVQLCQQIRAQSPAFVGIHCQEVR